MKFSSNTLSGHTACFVLFWALSLAVFHAPLSRLLILSKQDERYSQLLVIPLISAGLIYFERKRIFLEFKYCVAVGVPLLLAGMTLYFLAAKAAFIADDNANFSVAVLAIVVTWAAGFVLCYGVQSFQTAGFQILFLLLMIPVPPVVLDKIVFGLQKGSAQMSYVLFKLARVPVLWQGFRFSLPGVEIQIAEECSGLRSTIALLITSILAGHLFLRSKSSRIALILVTVPIAIFKNAARIVTISWLGVYVDRGFLYGRLHRNSGVPFSLLAIALLLPVLFALQKAEARDEDQKPSAVVPSGSATRSAAGREPQFTLTGKV